ncbi:MAG: homoserine O-succinyltransferase [Rhodobacterales bacterium]|nr:MAG: homoserine O-succinyltransferase [Rhodobacterales bacterium]
MPIKLPRNLPAFDTLSREGVVVMDEDAAALQDIRPLRIALLNLMPKKIQTENQFARLIGAGPLQIELTLIRMSDHQSRNTSADHMESFYAPFEEIDASGAKFDGLIITGAPVEQMPFNDVTYWPELTRVFDWTQTNVHSTFGVCWGGMAMINYFHGVPKRPLEQKAFGCYRHTNMAPASPYLRGFSDDLIVPVSRWTEVRQEDIDAREGLTTLLHSVQVGTCLVEDPAHRALYIFNHLEYDSGTLADEYRRDTAEGVNDRLPVNYFPADKPDLDPMNRWRGHAHLLYGNWINEIYATTPFDLSEIGQKRTDLRG